MGWPCKEAQSGSMVTIYRCMGLPTMYNSVSSGAILALRHFRYSRIWSADNINYAQFSSFVSQQHAWMKVHWMVVSSSWRRRWWIFVGVLRNSSFNLKKLLLCMTRIERCIFVWWKMKAEDRYTWWWGGLDIDGRHRTSMRKKCYEGCLILIGKLCLC